MFEKYKYQCGVVLDILSHKIKAVGKWAKKLLGDVKFRNNHLYNLLSLSFLGTFFITMIHSAP